jgi:hypothetical protein
MKEPTRNFEKGHASARVATTIFAATPPIIAVESLKTDVGISTQDTTSETPSSVYETLEPTLYSESSDPISPNNESVSHTETGPTSDESASTQHSETNSNQQTTSALTLIVASATTTISTMTTIAPDVKNLKNYICIT